MSSHPSGWYPDPEDPSRLRWWDGSSWTATFAKRTPASRPVSPEQGSFRGASLWTLLEPRTAAIARLLSGVIGAWSAWLALHQFFESATTGFFTTWLKVVLGYVLLVLVMRVVVSDRLQVFPEGVQESVWPRRARRVLWSEVAEFYVVDEHPGILAGVLAKVGRFGPVRRGGQVRIRLQPGGERLRARISKNRYAEYGALLSDYGTDPVELAAKLENFRLLHLEPSSTSDPGEAV